MDYIWFDDKSSIKNQLPRNFKSAAIIFSPFIQMPSNWVNFKQKNQFEVKYPSDEEILRYGKAIPWKAIEQESSFNNHKELAIALKTSILALKPEYSRIDLMEKIKLKRNIYYPSEDSLSPLLIKDFLNVISSKGANNLYFSAPTQNKSGMLQIKTTTPLSICDISNGELMLADENFEFAFLSLYDSFTTLFLTREENIANIIQTLNWEAVICDDNTRINWYL